MRYDGSGLSNRTFLHADERGRLRAERSPGAFHLYYEASPTRTEPARAPGPTPMTPMAIPAPPTPACSSIPARSGWKTRRFITTRTAPITRSSAGSCRPTRSGTPGVVNLYAYVGGGPVNATDPWGLAKRCHTRYVYSGGTVYYTEDGEAVAITPDHKLTITEQCFGTDGGGGGDPKGGGGTSGGNDSDSGSDEDECGSPPAPGSSEGSGATNPGRLPSHVDMTGASNPDFAAAIMDLLNTPDAARMSRRAKFYGQEVGFAVLNGTRSHQVTPWIWGDERSVALPSGPRVSVAVHFHSNDGRGGVRPSREDRNRSLANPEVVVLPSGNVQLIVRGQTSNIGVIKTGNSSCN